MQIYVSKIFRLSLLLAVLLVAACDHSPTKWKKSIMKPVSPRIAAAFEKTKTVCFGRFVIDVPQSATVVWADSLVPLHVGIYPSGASEVEGLMQKFISELKEEKAIYHDDVPLLLSVSDVAEPAGQIVTGYEGFEAINGLQTRGYFTFADGGLIIKARPLRNDLEGTIDLIKSIAHRLRPRQADESPAEPGNCIEFAFLPDPKILSQDALFEHIRIGFRLNEFKDTHLSIYVAPSNPYHPEGDSLEAQFKRIREEASPEEKKMLATVQFFREAPRKIAEWTTGYEVLVRTPDEEGSRSHHDFQAKFTGEAQDPFRPYADIQLQTGVADNAAGATQASVTDDEAIAIWDRIISTIRVRPTAATTADKSAATPRLPLGELATTGRTCPQSGWWESDEPGAVGGTGRKHLNAGDRMPHVTLLAKPSLWQKILRERPSYRVAAVWKLVAYSDAPAISPKNG